MTAHAGICQFVGRMTPDAMRRVVDAALVPWRGVERSWVEPGLAVVSRSLTVATSGEPSGEVLRSPKRLLLVWDGRLDNRHELLVRLHRNVGHDSTDGEIALAALEELGSGAFSRIRGDWSLVMWNEATRTLTLASDYMGVRPLYYCQDQNGVRWSSSLASLILLLDGSRSLDLPYMVGFVTGAPIPERTPYAGVHSVPSGHRLDVAVDGSVTRSRFWNMGSDVARYRDEQEFEHRLVALWREAVASRLRSEKPVWSQLSGGLDSSAMVCMADLVIRGGGAKTPALRTVSYVTNESPESDERAFIAVVERQLGRTGVHLKVEEHDCLGWADGWDTTPDAPCGATLACLNAVRDAGDRVLLTGQGGDAVMGNFHDYSQSVLTLLHKGRLIGAAQDALSWAISSKTTVFQILADALATRTVEREIRRSRRRILGVTGEETGLARGIDPREAFLIERKHIGLWEASHDAVYRVRLDHVNIGHRRLARAIAEFSLRRTFQSPELPGVTLSHPYLGQQLVEYVLSIPPHILCAPLEPRRLMRGAFRSLLPVAILERRSKAETSPAIARMSRRLLTTLMASCGGRVQDLVVTNLGVIDPARLLRRIEHVQAGTLISGEFVAVCILEAWLRTRALQGHSLHVM